jgi:Cu(I)/Ag(I) efflux system membrane fusion protein
METIKQNYKLIIIVLTFGILLGWIITPSGNKQSADDGHDHSEEVANQTWTCSMHPQIKKDQPGDCPICGMELIPLVSATATEDETDPNEIQMTESAMKLADVQTVTVQRGKPEKSILLQGKIKADERNIAKLTARFGGRIEKLFVNFKGQNVRKGEKLGVIYSPDLVTAQRELIEAAKYKDTNPSFYKASRNKLKLWDLTEKQIELIENSGDPVVYFDILSPISGTVTQRKVTMGDYVKEGSPLFEVTNLSRVWVMFDAYETDLPWISVNDKIDFNIEAMPAKKFSGKVSYIDPVINPKTRVAQVRVITNNPGQALKPEMFVTGKLISQKAGSSDELLIPKTSILWTGKRAVVYVKVPNREIPSFIYREITLGPEAGGYYVVAEGLSEGERIAANGVFKIDASAQLAGKPSMMNPAGGKISTGHNHGGKTMTDEEMAEMEEKEATNSSDEYNAPEAFKEQLGNLISAYLKLKDAFVATDEAKATEEAKNSLKVLKSVDMALLKGDAHIRWMELQTAILNNLNGIVQMDGVEMKRSHFSIISDELTKAAEMFGVTTTTPVYLEFCPMAFDNKGAYWISDSKEIRNPYFGDKMMTCGEVKKELK